MDDLRARFARFERIEEPDLWNEAVARAAELEATPARPAIPRLVLVAIALLVALAGAIAIGSWLNRPAPDDLNLNVDNGLVVGQYECDLLAYDPATGETESLVPSPPGCTDAESPPAQMAWSDDGRYLAYVVARMCGACFEDFPQEVLDAGGPWLYDNATGTARQLEPCPERYCESLDISPDGSLVAYTAQFRIRARAPRPDRGRNRSRWFIAANRVARPARTTAILAGWHADRHPAGRGGFFEPLRGRPLGDGPRTESAGRARKHREPGVVAGRRVDRLRAP